MQNLLRRPSAPRAARSADAANQPADSRLVRGSDGQATRAILVPDFGRTQTCVLVNLATLDCQPVSFGGFT